MLLICKSEEQKRHRNLQIEKMKSEMLNLQFQLQSMNTNSNRGKTSPRNENLEEAESGQVDGNSERGDLGRVMKRKLTWI